MIARFFNGVRAGSALAGQAVVRSRLGEGAATSASARDSRRATEVWSSL
jgi:hypothetical protein